MSNIQYLFLLFLSKALLTQLAANKWEPCACKEVNKILTFIESEFLGSWYEYSRTARNEDDSQDCVQYDFHETCYKQWPITISYHDLDTDEYIQNEVVAHFAHIPTEGVTPDGYGYRIIDTDYRNYAIFYACYSLGYKHKETTWIMTREKNIHECYLDYVNQVLLENGISPQSLVKTNQEC